MNICIGGDLDEQVIEHDGYFLKAATVNPDFKSEYYKQLFIQGDNKWYCWLETSIDLSEASDKAFFLFRKNNGLVS